MLLESHPSTYLDGLRQPPTSPKTTVHPPTHPPTKARTTTSSWRPSTSTASSPPRSSRRWRVTTPLPRTCRPATSPGGWAWPSATIPSPSTCKRGRMDGWEEGYIAPTLTDRLLTYLPTYLTAGWSATSRCPSRASSGPNAMRRASIPLPVSLVRGWMGGEERETRESLPTHVYTYVHRLLPFDRSLQPVLDADCVRRPSRHGLYRRLGSAGRAQTCGRRRDGKSLGGGRGRVYGC